VQGAAPHVHVQHRRRSRVGAYRSLIFAPLFMDRAARQKPTLQALAAVRRKAMSEGRRICALLRSPETPFQTMPKQQQQQPFPQYYDYYGAPQGYYAPFDPNYAYMMGYPPPVHPMMFRAPMAGPPQGLSCLCISAYTHRISWRPSRYKATKHDWAGWAARVGLIASVSDQ
jgi:hypothetical protein